MFWNKKKKAKKSPLAKSAALREQAMANAKKARAEIGEETLDRIAASMTKRQKNKTNQAREAIRNSDADHVAQELLAMMKDRDENF